MFKVFLIAAAIVTLATPSPAEDHPDEALYTYAIKNHKGKEPPRSERIRYECFNTGWSVAVNCAFFPGPLTKFDFVYTDKYAPTDTANVCSLVAADYLRAMHDLSAHYKSSADSKDTADECASVTGRRLEVVYLSRTQAMASRHNTEKCESPLESRSREIERARKEIATEKAYCAKRPAQETRQRDREREAAKREAAEFTRVSKSDPDALNFAQNLSDGKVKCGSECTVAGVSPQGPYSTITSENWRD